MTTKLKIDPNSGTCPFVPAMSPKARTAAGIVLAKEIKALRIAWGLSVEVMAYYWELPTKTWKSLESGRIAPALYLNLMLICAIRGAVDLQKLRYLKLIPVSLKPSPDPLLTMQDIKDAHKDIAARKLK